MTKKMNVKIVLIPLLCLGLGYQCWLLWQEYSLGTAPRIHFRPEASSDLPAISVCVPLCYTLPQSYLAERVARSSGMNSCGLWRETNQTNYARRCYDEEFLTADPTEPIEVRRFLLNSTMYDASDFLRMKIYVNDEAAPTGRIKANLQMFYLKRYDKHSSVLTKCWSFFSRSTKHWTEELKKINADQKSEFHDRDDGQIPRLINKDVDRPYRMNGISLLSLNLDLTDLIKHHYEIKDLNNLTQVVTLKKRIKDDLQRFEGLMPTITVAANSPYHVSGQNMPGLSTWLIDFGDVHHQILTTLDAANKSVRLRSYLRQSILTWGTSFTKTKLSHEVGRISSSGHRYSDFTQHSNLMTGYSKDDCQQLKIFINATVHQQRFFKNCIFNLNLVNNNHLDHFHRLGFDCFGRFCRKNVSAPETDSKVDLQRLLASVSPKLDADCPVDSTSLVFNFITQRSKGRTANFSPHPSLLYRFVFRPDPMPEMSIHFGQKMSSIELLANLAGLCGMWLGFSLLGFSLDLIRLAGSIQRKLFLRQNKKQTSGPKIKFNVKLRMSQNQVNFTSQNRSAAMPEVKI